MRNLFATGVMALALGALGGALLLGGGSDGASAEAASAAREEHRTVRIPAPRTARTDAASAEDMRVLVDPGFPDRARARRGDLAALCVPAREGLAECVVHVDGEAGAITATGPVRADEAAAILAVTGGTGRYAGSSGRLRLTPLGDGTLQAAFEMRLAGDAGR